ncbi:GNAT family N-acetyltransferase [Maribellus maritimus]|uniref:GNAT family N-acetyltransferase n=1 Tax=Maribellus maritimus TaxID=2870838 RepID=UPI001EEC9578|nr:GNAT family N-acetyltransferase [Maribellus maritimus]MCG6187807.1 GNAT family N-acetyltransferase [Maribellus maritimus]
MKLETNRLQLFEISWDDLEKIHELHSIPEVDEFNTLGIPENIEVTRKIISADIENQLKKTRSRFCWKVIIKENSAFAGLAGMTLSNDRFKMGEFYYKLFPKFWGNGYATEIARELIYFGFSEYKLHRIEAGVATKNLASIRVLEKAGMTKEGIRRKILPIRGEWIDNYHYSILDEEIK